PPAKVNVGWPGVPSATVTVAPSPEESYSTLTAVEPGPDLLKEPPSLRTFVPVAEGAGLVAVCPRSPRAASAAPVRATLPALASPKQPERKTTVRPSALRVPAPNWSPRYLVVVACPSGESMSIPGPTTTSPRTVPPSQVNCPTQSISLPAATATMPLVTSMR